MTNKKKDSHRFELKAIALAIALAFSLQQVAFAAPGIKSLRLPSLQKSPVGFDIPDSIARIDESYRAPRTGAAPAKTIILIQDSHTNESGQMNAAKTLDIILSEEKIKYVFLEAGSKDLSLSFLRPLVPSEKRKQVALSYLRKGLLQGSEYLDLTSDREFALWGVEDPRLYDESLKVYRNTAEKK